MVTPIALPSKFVPRKDAQTEIGLRARVVQFGDGYEQASEDGINNSLDTWNLTFPALREDDGDELIEFFKSTKRVQPILWSPNSDPPVKWRVSNIRRDFIGDMKSNISCTFRRVY